MKDVAVCLKLSVPAHSRPGGHFEFQWIQMQAVPVGGRVRLRTVRSVVGMQCLPSLADIFSPHWM